MRTIIGLWLAAFVSPLLAIHASEAGAIDWHKALIGLPLTALHTGPSFHRTEDWQFGATQSVVLTATASNVLAALHPENGTVAWRHVFDERDRVIAYKAYGNYVASLSGPGGATFRILDVHSGVLIVERQLHTPESGRLFEPTSLGIGLAPSAESDVFILTDGHQLRRVDGQSGDVQWEWASQDQASLYVYSNVVSTPSAIYLVGLAKSFASYTVHITAFSPTTGEELSSADIPSSITEGPSQLFVLSNKNKDSHVVWLQDGRIHSLRLAPDLKGKASVTKGATYKKLLDVKLCEDGQIVGIKEDGSGRVVKLADDGSLKVTWEFKNSATSKQYSESIYTGGKDMDGAPYIARVFWSNILRTASAHVLAPHLADGKGLVTGFTFPFATHTHGIITHVALDAVNPAELRVLSRLVLTTSTGAVQLWQQDQLQWIREEGLSDIRAVEMVELPEPKVVASQIANEENEAFSSRLFRQLSDAQNFPQYAAKFARRFATGSYASVSSSVASQANASVPLSRDAFGLRKIIVAATTHGKVFGIDSSSGEIVWSRVYGLGWAAEVGGRIIPLKMFVTRAVGDADGATPQVAIVAERKADNVRDPMSPMSLLPDTHFQSLTDTVVFHVDALTGADALGVSQDKDILQGKDVIAGSCVEAFLYQDDDAKFVLLFDEFLQTHIFPDTSHNYDVFTNVVRSLHFPLRSSSETTRTLTGHRINVEKEFTGKHVAYPTWTTAFPPNEDILSIITRPSSSPVASHGKVLGNRTTLYKYLNPSTLVVLTGSLPMAKAKSCGVYVLDGGKGTVLYHSILPASPSGECNVKAVFTENWLVYSYYDGELGAPDQAKSHRLVSVELYEGAQPDDKISSSELASYSNLTTHVSVYEQSFVFPRGILAMTTTSTKYGISVKDILIATDNSQIVSVPRRFLDPRRPKRKVTAEEAEEWLIQYDPLLPDDPKRVISHRYQISYARQILTSPSLLESTSLIFAYGPHDLFSTRSSPSGTFDVLSEDFNKLQLVLTISGLLAAILVTRPMVSRKKVKERWYD
ncbi:hypothetical protein EUX98_g2645 [Antrodiella citrinella]|uniref:ER membrane protein complex subunit 1 n=1 Tax=Antrodiella citrinella TaxID=2447956 RepID=A0A4S4MYI6_9APHY|nr:hypothetical protein EUX98_g2645 [Antrodiella citrinella]